MNIEKQNFFLSSSFFGHIDYYCTICTKGIGIANHLFLWKLRKESNGKKFSVISFTNHFSVLYFCIYGCAVVLNVLPLFNAILPLSSSFLRQSEPYVVNSNFQICEFASCLWWRVTVSIWRGHCVYSREWNEDFQWLEWGKLHTAVPGFPH